MGQTSRKRLQSPAIHRLVRFVVCFVQVPSLAFFGSERREWLRRCRLLTLRSSRAKRQAERCSSSRRFEGSCWNLYDRRRSEGPQQQTEVFVESGRYRCSPRCSRSCSDARLDRFSFRALHYILSVVFIEYFCPALALIIFACKSY